jgi:uncharacterized protein (TIGR02679 family)
VRTVVRWPPRSAYLPLAASRASGVEQLDCGPIVWTCENPDVVAAAVDALGVSCPPLICTGGWPSTACLRFVRAIGAAGAELRHHGDFDVERLQILDRLLSVTEGQLWRMAPEDYARCADAGAPVRSDTKSPQPPGSSLGTARRAHSPRRASGACEEQTLVELEMDLRAAADSAGR